MSDGTSKPPNPDLVALLGEGIAAARAGERERARDLLTRAVKLDDRSAEAWLWLSGVVDDLNNREACLQTALKLDPGSEAAKRGLSQVRQQRMNDVLRAGISAAQRGQPDHARALLTRVVEQDERNLTAWLWLSGVVTGLQDRETALENALSLDPGNEAVRRSLEQVREQIALETETRAEMAPRVAEVPEGSGPAPSPAKVEVDWSQPSALAEEFDNELLCPYCAALTVYEDERCRSCGNSLVLKTRRREERSSSLWIAITLQVMQVAAAVLSLFSLIVAVGVMLQSADLVDAPSLNSSLQFLLQFGSPPPAGMGMMLLYMRIALIATLLELLFQAVVLVGLYMRWKPFWYLFMVSAVLGLLLAVVSMLLTRNLICGGVVVLLSFAMVGLAFQMQDDFFLNSARILLRPDRSARSATDHLSHAREYARQRMWAGAIVHYQRAAGGMAGLVEPQLGLTLCYIQVRRYDRAAAALAEARQINPESPSIPELEAMLEEARRAAAPAPVTAP